MSKSSLTHAGKHMDTVSFVHSYFISLVQGFSVLKTKLIIFEIPFHLVNYHSHQFINVSFHSVFLHGRNSVVLASWLKRDLKYIHLLYQQIHFQRLIGAIVLFKLLCPLKSGYFEPMVHTVHVPCKGQARLKSHPPVVQRHMIWQKLKWN